MSENYFASAFKALDDLKEELIPCSEEGLEKLDKFYDGDMVDNVEVIDDAATSEEDLRDSYIGKIIVQCPICASLIYKDIENVVLDSDAVCVDDECPYCHTTGTGFVIVGQVAPYTEETQKAESENNEIVKEDLRLTTKENTIAGVLNANMDQLTNLTNPFELRDKVIEILDNSNIADKPAVERCKKILMTKKSISALLSTLTTFVTGIKVADSRTKRKDEKLQDEDNIGHDSVSQLYDAFALEFDKHGYDVTAKDVREYIESAIEFYDLNATEETPEEAARNWFEDTESSFPEELSGLTKLELDECKNLDEDLNNVEVTANDITFTVDNASNKITVENAHSCTPTPQQDAEVIKPLDAETKKNILDDSKEQDVDVTEFDEESFDDLSEKFLTSTYDNVRSYKTMKGSIHGNNVVLEGVVKFKSGKSVPTKYILEGVDITNTGKVRLIGSNKMFTSKRAPFTIKGIIKDNKFITESFDFNYIGKCANTNKLQRCKGTLLSK